MLRIQTAIALLLLFTSVVFARGGGHYTSCKGPHCLDWLGLIPIGIVLVLASKFGFGMVGLALRDSHSPWDEKARLLSSALIAFLVCVGVIIGTATIGVWYMGLLTVVLVLFGLGYLLKERK